MTPTMPLVSGVSIGPYQIIAPLGAGGMGEVYRATDTRLKRDVAIKVLPDRSRTILTVLLASSARRAARLAQSPQHRRDLRSGEG